MVTISLCMIVKNEEKLLGRCLESVKDIVDEIIIVDTGSNDNTKTIANKFTNLVYDFKWVDDFSKARNYSFSKASKDYILWLDADDIILEEDRLKLLNLKNNKNYNGPKITLEYIAKLVGVNKSTISREIKNRRLGNEKLEICLKTNRYPFICYNCPKKVHCYKKKYYYKFKEARRGYERKMKYSRIGIDMSIDEIEYWNE